jgi:hypothetical protein
MLKFHTYQMGEKRRLGRYIGKLPYVIDILVFKTSYL